METERVTASTTIEAAPEAVFAVLADPSAHADIDGTGWVREPLDGEGNTPPTDNASGLPLDAQRWVCVMDEGVGMTKPLLRKVDAVTFRVPDLDSGIAFYVDRLGHPLRWRNDAIGAAAVALPESDTEIVLTTQHGYEPNWLVRSADDAAAEIERNGGRILAPVFDIPVGRVAVVADPFDNVLVLVDLSKGAYETDDQGDVTSVS